MTKEDLDSKLAKINSNYKSKNFIEIQPEPVKHTLIDNSVIVGDMPPKVYEFKIINIANGKVCMFGNYARIPENGIDEALANPAFISDLNSKLL